MSSSNGLYCWMRRERNRAEHRRAKRHVAKSGGNVSYKQVLFAIMLLRLHTDIAKARRRRRKEMQLVDACYSGNYWIVDRLVGLISPDFITKTGHPIIAVASVRGHDKIVELLISAGANVNKLASDGISALVGAVTKGSTGCVRVLVTNGADTHIRFRSNAMTDIAKFYNNHEMLELLKLLHVD
jgi:hypothetical protein